MGVSGTDCFVDDPAIPSRAMAADDDLDTFSTAATISFIAGGALAVTGLLLLATSPDDPEASARAPTIRPYIGFGSIGASGRF